MDKVAELIKLIASSLVDKPEEVEINEVSGDPTTVYELKVAQEDLGKITGQKPRKNPAKKSIAAFKLREGDLVGYQVTLRGDRMRSFIDKLVHIALPRTKDFRGIETKGW